MDTPAPDTGWERCFGDAPDETPLEETVTAAMIDAALQQIHRAMMSMVDNHGRNNAACSPSSNVRRLVRDMYDHAQVAWKAIPPDGIQTVGALRAMGDKLITAMEADLRKYQPLIPSDFFTPIAALIRAFVSMHRTAILARISSPAARSQPLRDTSLPTSILPPLPGPFDAAPAAPPALRPSPGTRRMTDIPDELKPDAAFLLPFLTEEMEWTPEASEVLFLCKHKLLHSGRSAVWDRWVIQYDLNVLKQARLSCMLPKRSKAPPASAPPELSSKNIRDHIERTGSDEGFLPRITEQFTPTRAPPGSQEKLNALRMRVVNGVPLWHEQDHRLE